MTQPVTSPVTNAGSTALNGKVAAQIRALMAARRKTSAELGEALGISQSAAARRLRGEGTFNLNQIQTVADWLGLTVADIIAPAGTLDYSP